MLGPTRARTTVFATLVTWKASVNPDAAVLFVLILDRA